MAEEPDKLQQESSVPTAKAASFPKEIDTASVNSLNIEEHEETIKSDKREQKKSVKENSKTQVFLKKRFCIYPMRPLPSLDMPHAKAYVAEDSQATNRKIYALVVPPNVPLNYANLKDISVVQSASLLPFVDVGVVYWPPFSAKTKVVLYEQPLGGRVMESDNATCLPFDEADLVSAVFPSFVNVIEQFSSKNMTHRAIRPSNMYYMDEEKKQIVLGDCLTVPPAFEQAEVFETVPSAMCQPEGRGKGSISNDLYALAVSLVFLALGRNPLTNMSAHDVLSLKIKKGSYAALLDGQKVYLSVIEPLRGLLDDNPDHMWDLKNVKMWLEGQHMMRLVESKQSSQRPFLFLGEEYFSYRSLAFAFAEHWEQAAEAICSEKLNAWIVRGFNDTPTAERINRAIQTAKTNFAITEEQENYLITKVCMILDLQAPLRTRRFRLMPDGLGALLAMYALNKQDMKGLYSLISDGFLEMWYDVREDKVSRQYIKNLQKILSTRDLGMGMERCLYELNEGLQCLSPMVEQEYIDDVRQILPALETVSKRADTRSWPLDRHIVAFIAKHFGGKVGNQLAAINRPKASIATGGMLSLLAMLQWTFGPEILYGLTSWVGGLVSPVVESYHNRAKQLQIEKELPKYIRKGNLAAMYRFLDSQEDREADTSAFLDAKQQYAAIVSEISSLEDNKEEQLEYYTNLGYQVASILSFSIAILTMFFLLLYRFLRG